jgi:hypothetical protein
LSFIKILLFRLILGSVVLLSTANLIFVALIDLRHARLLVRELRILTLKLRVDKDHPIAHEFKMIRKISVAAFEHFH